MMVEYKSHPYSIDCCDYHLCTRCKHCKLMYDKNGKFVGYELDCNKCDEDEDLCYFEHREEQK